MANDSAPPPSELFQPVKDRYGNRLALVFGNEFKDGKCPFYQKQCSHCDIGAGEGTQFTTAMNTERLRFFRTYYASVLPTLNHLVVYNSGSVLNPKEMARETLGDILGYAASLDQCTTVSFDSREAFATKGNIDYLVAGLRQNQQARVILGLETQDDEIRMGKLKKRMTKESIEKVFETIGSYQGKVGLDINFVFQPPEIVGEEAIRESVRTVDYCLDLAKKYKVPLDFNFHPYYPSKKSKGMFPHHPRASVENTKKALLAMKEKIDERKSDAKIFIGWQDEEHDQEQRERKTELEQVMKDFERFNLTQKF